MVARRCTDTGCFSRNTDAVGIAIGNFATETDKLLYVCQTPGAEILIFRDEAVSNGIGPVTRNGPESWALFWMQISTAD